MCSEVYKTDIKHLYLIQFLTYNLFGYSLMSQRAKMVRIDTENIENTFIKGFLNINECFIWFGNLFIICRYSE